MMSVRKYRRIIEKCFPELQIRKIEPIHGGWDNFVVDINGEIIFRFPKRPDVEAQQEKEVLLLPEVSKRVHLAVPFPEYLCTVNKSFSHGFFGCRKIEGTPLTTADIKSVGPEKVARQLSNFLNQLHHFPLLNVERLKVTMSDGAGWRQRYLDFYSKIQVQVLGLLDETSSSQVREFFEEYLGFEVNFKFEPVLIHGDLSSEHILFDAEKGLVTGVIDWGDSTVGDPAFDFTGLKYDFGDDFTGMVLSGYEGVKDTNFVSRIKFYSRLIPFYEVIFGQTVASEAHVQHGLASIQQEH